jgi:iron complex outermembrane recepter protein
MYAAVLAGAVGALANTVASGATTEIDELDELVVTAQKREEPLRDVPASISVLSGSELEKLAASSLVDIASLVPGLAVQSGGSPGQTGIVLRGISTGNNTLIGTSNLVSTYIDDSPVGSSSGFAAAGATALDLVPYDIERIEVLRGPQGTLYGASAMGGLLKYVLKSPDLHQFEGRAGADVQHIDASDGAGWGVRAAVNVPIVDGVLGVRASGFYKDSAGYIDNVGLGIKGENWYTQDGGRVAALWVPSEAINIRASALLQNVDSHGNAAVSINEQTRQPIYGDYARSTLTPEYFRQHLEYYSLTGDLHLPFATLTSASSWSHTNNTTQEDLSGVFAQYIPLLTTGSIASGATAFGIATSLSKFTEELRLASPGQQRLEWMLGLFYTHENALNFQDLGAETLDGQSIASINPMLLVDWPTTYRETAGFGNVTFAITDRFDVTGGLRYSTDSQNYQQTVSGSLSGPAQTKNATADESVTTWSTSARLHVSDKSMIYARVATGYRPGGPNVAILGIPPSFAPDKLTDYEIGMKGETLDRKLQMDVSVFYIDWKNIQLTIMNAQGLSYPGNGSGASSQGTEVTTTYRLSEGLRVRGTLAYTDAHLTADAPALFGRAGDQLPMSPRWNGSLSVDYQRALADNRTLEFGGAYSYVDKVYNHLQSAPNAEPMGPQNVSDLYAGLTVRKVTARLFLKNAFNDHAYSELLNNYHPVSPQFVPIQPRTVGLSLDTEF